MEHWTDTFGTFINKLNTPNTHDEIVKSILSKEDFILKVDSDGDIWSDTNFVIEDGDYEINLTIDAWVNYHKGSAGSWDNPSEPDEVELEKYEVSNVEVFYNGDKIEVSDEVFKDLSVIVKIEW
jgi:hypothetical protein